MSDWQPAAAIALWLSLALIFHSYLGIKLAAILIARRYKPKPSGDEFTPEITVIVPAYNEEKVIGRKLDNLLAQNYPHDKLHIVVGSDMSTDATHEIVRGYANSGVELAVMTERSGKNGIDDKLIPLAKTAIVAVTDANIHFEPDALRELVRPFSDPGVGAVSGNMRIRPPEGAGGLQGEQYYWDHELGIRKAMGRTGALVSCIGGIYAVRREWYRPLGPGALQEDVVVAMEMLAQGRKVVFAENAEAEEIASDTISKEFRHRVRLATHNHGTVGRLLRLAVRAEPLVFFFATSYKLLRWMGAYFWLIALVAAFGLRGEGFAYKWLWNGFLAGMELAALGFVADLFKTRIPIATAAYHYAAMCVASFVGLFKWLKDSKPYWTPPAR